ncbi:MAG: DUF4386 family protein [Candidatus Marinimicrobia bacterium]|nr:DUF4386 family protein [Candidatus Neomarinimicrobiota bacterium]
MRSINAIARLTGVLFIVMTIAGPFSMVFVPSQIITPGDAAATAIQLAESERLFRFGLLGHIIILFADIGVALLLYVLLKPAGKALSLIAAGFRMVMVAIRSVNLMLYFLALLLVSGAGYLAVFESAQLDALVLISLNLFERGVAIDLLFFGPHLILVGYLIVRSQFIPGIIGYMVILSGLGYLIDHAALFLAPGYNLNLVLYTFWGEVVLAFWLLIKGVNAEAWAKQAADNIY